MTRIALLSVAGAILAAGFLGHLRAESPRGPTTVAEQSPAIPELTGSSEHGATAVQRTPARPKVYLETTPVALSGRIIAVPTGGNLQAALDEAQPGDTIELPAGAVFRGNFVLRQKRGAGHWILIRSSSHDRLPPPGTRVSPAHAHLMAKVISPNASPALSTAQNANHYRIVGIEITTTHRVNFNLVYLESPRQTSVDRAPSDIILDRCYIHGTPAGDIRRGVALNGVRLAVIDSYLSDFHERGADSQAIAGWNGPGPFKIVNNYLEGAGENLMFGGADPAIPGLVPADIEIRRNHFRKPAAWRIDDPEYAGLPWTVKNLFELKNARRVLVDGNVFEQSWVHAQTGFAVLLTVRNQDGGSPWSVVEDVTFTNNVVRHTANGINILGRDDNHPSGRTSRVLIKNNLFYDVGGNRWGGGGRMFQFVDGAADVLIDHNTAIHTGPIVMADGAPHAGLVFRNNIVVHNEYGVFGSGRGIGSAALDHYFPGAAFTHNVIIGDRFASSYPPGNFFPPTVGAVGFANPDRREYQLAKTSRYRRAGTDGRDIGVDFGTLLAALPGWWRSSPQP